MPQQVKAVPYAARPHARVGFSHSRVIIMNTVIPLDN